MNKQIYSTPDSDLHVEDGKEHDLPLNELKGIINSWHRLVLLCVLWGLGLVAGLAVFVAVFIAALSSEGQVSPMIGVFLVLPTLSGLAIYGTLSKKSWGRILGMVMCSIMLLGIPLGTILGIMGLFGYSGAKSLFGESALNYQEVKLAYKRAKA